MTETNTHEIIMNLFVRILDVFCHMSSRVGGVKEVANPPSILGA